MQVSSLSGLSGLSLLGFAENGGAIHSFRTERKSEIVSPPFSSCSLRREGYFFPEITKRER